MKRDNTPVDIDFAEAAVPHYARRGIVTMFMIMLGFTFFSASMWVGKELADGLNSAIEGISKRGGARLGDKTLMDALDVLAKSL